jgi:hypothetical protein
VRADVAKDTVDGFVNLSLLTLATQFDAARTADPLLTRWPLSGQWQKNA